MSHRQYVNMVSWKYLASKVPSSDIMAFGTIILNFPDCKHSIVTTPTKLGRLGNENNYVRHTHSYYVYLNEQAARFKRMVASYLFY